jgi:hypothetical protein
VCRGRNDKQKKIAKTRSDTTEKGFDPGKIQRGKDGGVTAVLYVVNEQYE